MEYGFTTAAYVVAAVLFIQSLGGLSGQESAKRAVWYGIVGMALAVLATLYGPGAGNWLISLVMIVIGGAIGWVVAQRVQMTEMPQLVAAMHSLVGLAAVLIGFNTHIELIRIAGMNETARHALTGFAAVIAHKTPVEINILRVETFLGIFIGAVTFTGSIIAFGKLAGRVDGKAKKLPGGHVLNAAAAIISLVMLFVYLSSGSTLAIVIMTLAALFIGYHLIMGIGGADMPVVVSMLNSYSGWAAAAIGFSLSNDLLIVVGALVGSSGAILSYIMCKAMNRSFISVILGGFGGTSGPAMAVEGEQIAIDTEGVAAALNDADRSSSCLATAWRWRRRKGRFPNSPASCVRRARKCASRSTRLPVAAGPHERAARRSQGALRHRSGNGRDQRGLPEHRRRHRHRLQRHRQPGRPGRPELPDRRHAGSGSVEGQAGLRVQARPGHGLFRNRESAVL